MSPETRRICRIGTVECGHDLPLLIIAGPCAIESEAQTLDIARHLEKLAHSRPISLIFKASFDKANRTSGTAYRGPGQVEGLRILAKVREQTGLMVTTDVHLPEQASAVAKVVDLLQIPAFLCRQTDLLLAAGSTGKAVNVKKGQFVAPEDMQHAVTKLHAAGCHNVMLCERGTFFGYGRLVNDFRALPIMQEFQVPVIFDATHSVQLPGGLGGSTGGNRGLVAPLARAAVAVGVDGVFLETHPDPDHAPSDGPNMVPLDQMAALIDTLLRIRDAIRPL